MPLVSEPWFEVPLVTEWSREKGTNFRATRIERFKVTVRDMPSVLGYHPDVVEAMNEYDQWQHEQEQGQMEGARKSG